MKSLDAWGVEHPVAEQHMEGWNRVIVGLASHDSDTASTMDRLLTDSEGEFPAALALKGLALMFKGRRDLYALVDEVLDHESDFRNRYTLSNFDDGLFTALRAWRNDDYAAVERALEELVGCAPRHLLSVKLQHGFLFLAGRREAMARAAATMLERWDQTVPGFGFVLGCASFALGELDRFEESERLGRLAVAHEPNDAWGIHAVSHVFEMRDDNAGGVDWLETHRKAYERCNNFRAHVFWHLGLFELSLGHIDRVYDLLDAELRRPWVGDYRDMSNVVSLLWRLEADGFDVGDRWERWAEISTRHHTDHGSAFADAHYVLALARAGRAAELAEFFASLDECSGSSRGQGHLVKTLGKPLCEAIAAFGADELERATELFDGVASQLVKIGGSNAQRDLFEQLHIHAALSGGNVARGRSLLASRLARRPHNPWALQRVD